ncbi:MAG: hypothetical protein K2J10_07650, partial [Muribaculaceae bacterium]|nr:hypothetical protein [Muribaculaceae bacterium]
NCCKRFCRPVPNHSAKEPYCGIASAKLKPFFELSKFILQTNANYRFTSSADLNIASTEDVSMGGALRSFPLRASSIAAFVVSLGSL